MTCIWQAEQLFRILFSLLSNNISKVHTSLSLSRFSYQFCWISSFTRLGEVKKCDSTIEPVLQFCWERLHVGYWKDVAVAWRDLYAVCAIIKAACQYCTSLSVP
jgi:hypothetical protein